MRLYLLRCSSHYPRRSGMVTYFVYRSCSKTPGHDHFRLACMLSEQCLHQLRCIIVFRKMGEQHMAHEARLVEP